MRKTAAKEGAAGTHLVERVQTGVRLEKRLLKVLKTLAEYLDMSLGDLLEGIVLHVFDGKQPFGPESRQRIAQLREFYGLDLRAEASHLLQERDGGADGTRRQAVPAGKTGAKRPTTTQRTRKERQA